MDNKAALTPMVAAKKLVQLPMLMGQVWAAQGGTVLGGPSFRMAQLRDAVARPLVAGRSRRETLDNASAAAVGPPMPPTATLPTRSLQPYLRARGDHRRARQRAQEGCGEQHPQHLRTMGPQQGS